jgi:hypothetical protein
VIEALPLYFAGRADSPDPRREPALSLTTEEQPIRLHHLELRAGGEQLPIQVQRRGRGLMISLPKHREELEAESRISRPGGRAHSVPNSFPHMWLRWIATFALGEALDTQAAAGPAESSPMTIPFTRPTSE